MIVEAYVCFDKTSNMIMILYTICYNINSLACIDSFFTMLKKTTINSSRQRTIDTSVTSFKSTAEYIRVEAKLITGIHYECVENRFVKVSPSSEQGVALANATFPSLSTTTTIYFRTRPDHIETPTEPLCDWWCDLWRK